MPLTYAHYVHKSMSMVLTTAQDCAARWGVSESTARRILAPLAQVDRDPDTGAMRYDQDAADAARAEQPGRGQRSDLTTEAVSPADYQRLTIDDSIPVAHRALWTLLWEGGLRFGDALSLDVRDVSPDGHRVAVDFPKSTSDDREILLSDAAADLTRAAMGGRSEGPLLTRGNRPISRQEATRIARLVAGVGIHGFRTGGRQARKGHARPPQITYEDLGLSEKPCPCPCADEHPLRGNICSNAVDPVLLVDVTILNPLSGDADRRLRPLCAPCYDALVKGRAADRDLKKGV